ncbi:hypothetical protein Hypma_010426 [Hypsizygus marmoreus]|uniref:Uncharacterized protein n=1 Tax=Hypsizygus marmoreus TaxID=39966 RepID=A0A369JPE6_HYPMA|nr:hypothetical protein Hypma_010426 [Hypsizygus marmoreus]
MKGRSDVDLCLPWPLRRSLEFDCQRLLLLVSYHQPAECLELLKMMPEKNTGIDELYRTKSQILITQPSGDWWLAQSSFLNIFVAKTRDFLAVFLNLEASKIASILRPLHAVMKIPKDDPTFFVDYDIHHALLAKQCFWFHEYVAIPRCGVHCHRHVNGSRSGSEILLLRLGYSSAAAESNSWRQNWTNGLQSHDRFHAELGFGYALENLRQACLICPVTYRA